MMTIAAVAALASGASLWWVKPNAAINQSGPNVFNFDVVRPTPFDEAIVSWNLEGAESARVQVEAQAVWPDRESKWYQLGNWSKAGPRDSVKGQRDADGDVLTDTLSLKQATTKLRVRLTVTGNTDGKPSTLRLVTASLIDSKAAFAPDVPSQSDAWGKTIEIPKKRQRDYRNGGVICSPTSLTMVLNHYGNKLNRADLLPDVPQVVDSVWDGVYKGAGNWPFNAAFAGSFPGLSAYVSRFASLGDLEACIAAGFPVVCSVSYDLLRGKELSPSESGHLVVLVGFTESGDPVFNDPAYPEVRKIYKRSDFVLGWNYSHRTVYLVHPDSAELPKRGGAWILSSATP